MMYAFPSLQALNPQQKEEIALKFTQKVVQNQYWEAVEIKAQGLDLSLSKNNTSLLDIVKKTSELDFNTNNYCVTKSSPELQQVSRSR